MNKLQNHAHALPYIDAAPGLYRYADGCCVRKAGNGAYSFIPYDAQPLPSHTEQDFINHPDNQYRSSGQ